jgi:DNA invertase Pin-like site-specific DNA recombinase
MLPCVIYAAKSSEDLRGSLTAQIEDCRSKIGSDSDRTVVSCYADEAVSGFSSNRGPELSAALSEVQALAAEHGTAELWVQHSDRLARGDGRKARHVVEIALWALKVGVTIRTVEDVDTFRDLLYAVVTGQRNHEDSKRKGAATAGGLRRAIYRGEYAGQPLDGYRVLASVDKRGHVKKRLEFDPERRALLRLIFRLAHQGIAPSEIARRINKAGWLTAPRKRELSPEPFTPAFIRWILLSPRYAGLSVYKGEVVAKGQWPAYISVAKHERLAARVRRTQKQPVLPREPFLLARLAGCAVCASYMITVASPVRRDGTRRRTYVCHQHRLGRCAAAPIDARIVDHVFVSHLNRFIGDPEQNQPYYPSPGFPRELIRGEPDERWEHIQPFSSVNSELKLRIRAAITQHSEEEAERLLDELVQHRERMYQLTHAKPTRHQTENRAFTEDPLTLLQDFYSWSARDLAAELYDQPEQTLRLNRVLRRWFSRVMLISTDRGYEIAPIPSANWPSSQRTMPTAAFANPDSWQIVLHLAGPGHRDKDPWRPPEILHALQSWAEKHGRAPHTRDWAKANSEHPNDTTVIKRFGRWNAAIKAAHLTPAPVARHTHRDADGNYARRDQSTGRST